MQGCSGVEAQRRRSEVQRRSGAEVQRRRGATCRSASASLASATANLLRQPDSTEVHAAHSVAAAAGCRAHRATAAAAISCRRGEASRQVRRAPSTA